MKNTQILKLERFLEIADKIDMPFKFYEKREGRVFASLDMNRMQMSFDGMESKELVRKLELAGFVEVIIRDVPA